MTTAAQASLATASLGLQVFEATNRKPVVLAAVAQERKVAAVVQVHAARVAAIVLSRTPEERVVALAVEIPIVAPVASRQRRESVGVRPVAVPPAIIIPAACGLEHLACRAETANCGEKHIPLCCIR